ncbi:MAG: winged helix-turn-helix domain-containing protein [Pyrinomonadaceae bacterium]|nr:winged helix-turn-helix domain-containing protein [Pyrinomonadaceae bacterium]
MSRKSSHLYEFDQFRIDVAERLLLREGEVISMTPKVFDTLLLLVENSGHVMGKEELIEKLWPDTFVEEGNLTQNISRLRKLLGEGEKESRYIQTLPRRGYRFVAQVREITEDEEQADQFILRKRTRAHIVKHVEEDQAAPLEAMLPQTALEETGHAAALLNIAASEAVAIAPQAAVPHAIVRRPFWKSRAALLSLLLLFAITGLAAYFWLSRRARQPQTPAEVKTLAVLPFKEISSEQEEKYLGIGMADALITKFGNVRQIIVRPTSAVRRYVDSEKDALAAGRELRVEAVLEGNIQRAGDSIRVSVQLLRVADGAQLWGETFNDKFTDIFAVQDSISAKVLTALTVKLSGEESERLKKSYTENLQAYEAYLKGRYFWNKRNAEGFKKAAEFFKQATDIDPNYALAYVGLADSYGLTPAYTGAPPKDYFPLAKAAALRALELDDKLAEAHASLGWVHLSYDWDWPRTEAEFRRAIELNPNYSTAHQWYGMYLGFVERHEQAIAEVKHAQQLDPLSLPINSTLANSYFYARRYDEAIEQFRKTLDLDSNYMPAHYTFARTYLHSGMFEEAIKEAQLAVKLSNGLPITQMNLATIYAGAGRRDEALRLLDQLSTAIKEEKVPSVGIALIHARLGNTDEAFAWLEKAFERRDINVPLLKATPEFDILRPDPRFAAMLKRAGF